MGCEKIVTPIVLGRANYQCPNCQRDMTLEVVLQYEADQEHLQYKDKSNDQ